VITIKLTEMKNGQTAEITNIKGGREFQQKVAQLNIRIGKKVKKIVSEPFKGPIIIMVDNSQAAIGRGIAERICVK